VARKVGTNLDLLTNELLNAGLQNLSGAPSSPKAGRIYYDTTKKEVGFYNGTEWKYLGAASSGITEAEVLTLIAAKLNGLSWKQPCLLATAAALPANTQSGSGVTGKLTANSNEALTVDGFTSIAIGARILVKNEATESHNGIYEITAAGSAGAKWVLTRTADANTGAEIQDSTMFVEKGTANEAKQFSCSTKPEITIDTTSLTFVEIQSGLSVVGDGTYTQRSGNQIQVKPDETVPAEPAEGAVSAEGNGVARKKTFRLRGNGSLTEFTITHNLNTRLLIVQGQENSSGNPTVPIELDWEANGVNTVLIKFPSAISNSTNYFVTIIG
jgi:hypothetical protein